QPYAHFEVILVNDGSTDGSRDLCRTFAEQDGRVRLIDKPNQGVGKARNDGIDAARGRFVYMMDADDELEPDLLTVAMAALEQNPVDMLVFGYRKMNTQGHVIGEVVPPA